MPEIKVGCILPKVKFEEMNFMGIFANKIYDGNTVKIITINPLIDLKDQERCDCIFHKVHDFLIMECNIRDLVKFNYFHEKFYKDAETLKIPLIDSKQLIETLENRIFIMELILKSALTHEGITITSPESFLLEKKPSPQEFLSNLAKSNVRLPFITKSLGGFFSDVRYDMSLHFSEKAENYESLFDQISYTPCFIQNFYNHGGLLFKVFIVGDSWDICSRPSIVDQDFTRTQPIYFKSNTISKINAKSEITSKINLEHSNELMSRLNRNAIQKFIDNMRSHIDFNLIGMDIIVCDEGRTYYVVDVNYFPGYKNYPNLEHHFYDMFIKSIERSKK